MRNPKKGNGEGKKTKKELLQELEELRAKLGERGTGSESRGSGVPRRTVLKTAWVAPVILSIPVPLSADVSPPSAPTTMSPTNNPTRSPTNSPTTFFRPTTMRPTKNPTQSPTTSEPTFQPTKSPTNSPTRQGPTIAVAMGQSDTRSGVFPTVSAKAFPAAAPVADARQALFRFRGA